MNEIKLLLEEYDRAVKEEDIPKISSYFHETFMLSTSTELWQLNNNDEFRSSLKKSFHRYNILGAKYCKMSMTDIKTISSNHCIATVKWGLIDNQHMIIDEFDISYNMKLINDKWKYILVIEHK